MYVVRNKKTKELIHMANSVPGVDRKPEEIFRDFDPATMELGRFHEQYLPEEFSIEDGVVKEKVAKGKGEKSATQELKDLKTKKLLDASRQAFEQRQKLVPDHEALNAALGIYDEKRTKKIQETVKAFRDAYKQFEAELEKAKTVKAVEDLEPEYPTKLVS